MQAKFSFMNDLVNKNHQTFSEFKNIKWINPYQAGDADLARENIIKNFSSKVNWSFKQTKPWINNISKGCELCGQGEWSCLFITGRCNANCFYCPASQNSDDTPTAQQLSFESADEYANFINYFKFKGCSFSGGEPFLVFDKVLGFLHTVREKCNPDLYIWMYTNGILGTEEKYRKLAEFGINEVRFDIGATNYKIDTIKKASGIIENITVEIPMDPNKIELLKEIIPQLQDLGVGNLNLHQMRLTKYNVDKLLTKDYTFLHGEHPVVLESELAALEIIGFVDSENLKIGVNYCAFQYKNRFQKAGYRSKLLKTIDSKSDITENGYAINVYVSTSADINEITFNSVIIDQLIEDKILKKITVSEYVENYMIYEFVIIDFNGTVLMENSDDNKPIDSISIENRNYLIETGRPVEPIIIVKSKMEALMELFKNINPKIPEDNELFQVWRYLKIEHGFRPFF